MARGRSSRRAGRHAVGRARPLLTALALTAVAALPALVPPAHAVVVCQRKQKLTLRADQCKTKETQVADLSAVVARGTDLTARAPQVDSVKLQLGFACPGAPSLKLVASNFDSDPHDGSLIVERAGGGCRSLDGNQAACVASFQNGDPFDDRRDPQATPCFFFNNQCLPCSLRAEGLGHVCPNTCTPPPTCADATRTVFAGGSDIEACQQFEVQADCEKAWHAGGNPTALAASCFWTGSACEGCGPHNQNKGSCTNTCAPSLTHPTCKDPTRVTFAGGPQSDACEQFNGNQANCEKAYHEGGDGIAASCWFQTSSTNCNGCGLRHELAGDCTNTCL